MDNSVEEELWRPIQNWESRYEVSNLGRVRSLPSMKVMKPQHGNCMAYTGPTVLLSDKRRRHTRYVADLVARAWVLDGPDRRNKLFHKDLNMENTRADNLEWVTARQKGQKYMYAWKKTNTWPCRRTKLTQEIADSIRELSKKMSNKELAEAFKVSHGTITQICKGTRWKRPHEALIQSREEINNNGDDPNESQ